MRHPKRTGHLIGSLRPSRRVRLARAVRSSSHQAHRGFSVPHEGPNLQQADSATLGGCNVERLFSGSQPTPVAMPSPRPDRGPEHLYRSPHPHRDRGACELRPNRAQRCRGRCRSRFTNVRVVNPCLSLAHQWRTANMRDGRHTNTRLPIPCRNAIRRSREATWALLEGYRTAFSGIGDV